MLRFSFSGVEEGSLRRTPGAAVSQALFRNGGGAPHSTQLWTQKTSRLNQSSIFRAPCVCLSTPRVCSRFPSVSCPTSQSQGCWRSRCVSAFVLISLWSFFICWSPFGICLFCIGDLSAGDHSWVFVLYCSQCLARLFAGLLPKLMACLNDLTSLSHRWLEKKINI